MNLAHLGALFVGVSALASCAIPGGPAGAGGTAPVPAVPVARDPRCPAAPPTAGAPCDPQPAPLSCEYGGDAHSLCTTLLLCAETSLSGGFTWLAVPASGCNPIPAGCPLTFEAVAVGATCTADLSCAYDQGVCGGVCVGAKRTWRCRAWSDVSTQVNIVPMPSFVPHCPPKRPLIGDACAIDQQACEYGSPCSQEISLGPSLTCINGFWEEGGEAINCGATHCSP